MIFHGPRNMNAMLQRRLPAAGALAAVRFTQSVGVAPGTTTLAQHTPGELVCLGGPATCPADPTNQYMLARVQRGGAEAPGASAAMRQAQYEVYGNETSMNGLGVAELGPSWSRVLLVALGAALLGAGAAVLVSRSKA